jgi:pyruvate formate lyase activating enzyme
MFDQPTPLTGMQYPAPAPLPGARRGGAPRSVDATGELASARATDLRIGGLTPLTTVDYPGELAAIVFCQGCPWRCRYCHNGHLLLARSKNLIAWTEVRSFLEKRHRLLDAVVFSGGEPTLQSALPAAMAEAKAMGYKVGLHTAGPYPERLRRVLRYLDWVGMDIKALPEDYPAITGVPRSGRRAWESLKLILDFSIALEVRTTRIPGQDSADRVLRLEEELFRAGVRRHVLQECRTERTLDAG